MSGTNLPTVINAKTTNMRDPGDSRTYSFALTLTPGVVQQVDLRTLQNLNLIKGVQGIWIDNSEGSASCSVSMGSNQDFIVPATYQGMSPAFVNFNTPVFSFAGNGTVQVTLTNFPVPVGVWPTTIGSGGTQIVSDPALEALIINGAFQTSEALYGPEDVIIHGRSGGFTSGTITIPGTTTIVAGAPNAFLTNLKLTADPNVTATGGETITLTVEFVNAGTVAVNELIVPAVAGTVASGPINILNLDDINILGSIAGDNLVIVATGTALTTGSIRYTAIGGGTALT